MGVYWVQCCTVIVTGNPVVDLGKIEVCQCGPPHDRLSDGGYGELRGLDRGLRGIELIRTALA